MSIPEGATDALRDKLKGELVSRDSPNYGEAAHIWNTDPDNRPALIARCRGAADVCEAVKFGTKYFGDGNTSIRSGGHSMPGLSTNVDGFVIDMTLMRSVIVDPNSETAWVEAGAVSGDLDRETTSFGFAGISGQVSDTGFTGLMVGGGMGHLSRQYGLAIDNVIEMNVVTAEGELLRVSKDSHPDLFWGVRGSGGNLGIVTGTRIKLHKIPDMMYGGFVFYDIKDLKSVYKTWKNILYNGPMEICTNLVLANPPPLGGKLVCGLCVAYTGDAKSGEKACKVLKECAEPLVFDMKPMTYCEIQSQQDPLAPHSNYYVRSKALKENLDDDTVVEMLTEVAHSKPPPAAVLVETWGGAIRNVSPTDTAFVNRNNNAIILFLGLFPEKSGRQATVDWINKSTNEILKGALQGSGYVNYSVVETEHAFKENYDRLVDLKNKYDPTNFFRRNQNIAPTVRSSL